MLLDKYSLSKSFENLLQYHNPSSATPHAAPAGFVKRVNQTMTRIDPLLKTLQVRPSPPEALVQAYLIHIGDRSDTNFKKILDLKGIRKPDQVHLIELFQIHREGSSKEKLVQSSPLLTPLMNSSGLGSINAGAAALSAASGAALQTRFDASSIGEKLLSAAREISTAGSAVQSSAPGAEKATINENLKNFGRFFKQDLGSIGGFAARFGKRDGSQPAHGDESR